MRIFLLFCLLSGILSCGSMSSDPETRTKETVPPYPDSPPGISLEKADPLMDTLLKLPFIIKSNQYIDSMTARQQGISFMTDTLENSYEVRAGYNGAERFETYFQLSIDKQTMEIKVMDPVEGEYIPLKDYLKNNQ